MNDANHLYTPKGTTSYDHVNYDSEYINSGYDGVITSAITSTDDYFLRVDLNDGEALDVGAYTPEVEQLTEGLTSRLTQSLSETMTDDYGSKYTSAFDFPLTVDDNRLSSRFVERHHRT